MATSASTSNWPGESGDSETVKSDEASKWAVATPATVRVTSERPASNSAASCANVVFPDAAAAGTTTVYFAPPYRKFTVAADDSTPTADACGTGIGTPVGVGRTAVVAEMSGIETAIVAEWLMSVAPGVLMPVSVRAALGVPAPLASVSVRPR